MTEATCQERIPDGGRAAIFHTCGRKLSGSEDYPELCGFHASVKRRRKSKAAARDLHKAQIAAGLSAADERAATLSQALGVTVSAETALAWTGPDAGITKPTGFGKVSLDALQQLADRIHELENR